MTSILYEFKRRLDDVVVVSVHKYRALGKDRVAEIDSLLLKAFVTSEQAKHYVTDAQLKMMQFIARAAIIKWQALKDTGKTHHMWRWLLYIEYDVRNLTDDQLNSDYHEPFRKKND